MTAGRAAPVGALLLWALAGCQSAPPVAPDPATPASAPSPMTRTPLTVSGTLDKQRTVGYRSPYRLTLTDPASVEALARVAGAPGPGPVVLEVRGRWEALDAHLGQAVTLRGVHVVQPGSKAPPGSEAASRFVGGQIPPQIYLEVDAVSAAD